MAAVASRRLVMLGPAPRTRGSVCRVLEAYRAQGLFVRWPIEYVATHGAGSPPERSRVAISGAARFAALLARDRRLVLHVHASARAGFWRDAAYVGAALAAGCPVILQLHGGGFEAFYDRSGIAGQAFMRSLLERAACVAVPSPRTAAWARSVAAQVRAEVLPVPVALAPVQPGPRHNLVLFLGRLHADNGVFELVDALAELRAAVPDVRLVCAGEGERAAVSRYAERLGIGDAVKLTGWVGPSGKRALLESAAVCVWPSQADGVPLSLLEAMAAGVPVIASRAGAVPEVLVDGVSGLLAAPGDTATLQRLLRQLLLGRELAARIGAAGRETVRIRFSPQHALRRLEALYAELGLAQTGITPSSWPASQAG